MKKLNEILGTKYPFIQGGMANIATGEFAAACSNAGALGMIATGGWDGDRLRQEIRRAKELTDKPFGVNLMLMSPYADDIAQIILEEGVKVVTTGARQSRQVHSRLEGKGHQGDARSGGGGSGQAAGALWRGRHHRRGHGVRRPRGRDDHHGPGAPGHRCGKRSRGGGGGIADGRQAAAAFALGACGIQVGTCLLASEECPIHPNYKQAVLKAKDSDTVVTGRSIGGPVRILKNKMAREYLALEKRGASLEELEKVTLGGLRRAVLEGDVEMGSVMSGQVAGMLHEIRPVAEIFRDLYESGIARAKATAAEWSDAE